MTPSGSPQESSPGVDQERIWDTADQAGEALEGASSPGSVAPAATAAAPTATAVAPAAATGAKAAAGAGSPSQPVRQSSASPAWTQSLTSTATQPGPAGLSFADVPDRVIALILDLIVLAILGMLLALLIGQVFGGLSSGDAAAGGSLDAAGGGLNVAAFLVVGIAQLALSFAYFGYSWVVLRGTAGMKALSLQVGDQSDGHAISWDQGLLRWLLLGLPATLTTFAAYVPSVLGLVLGVFGSVWLVVLLYSVVKSPTRQGWHDRYARTIVVRVGRRST